MSCDRGSQKIVGRAVSCPAPVLKERAGCYMYVCCVYMVENDY